MTKLKTFAWVTALLVATAALAASAAPKVTICHIPPGNPGNAHTITVGEPAVNAHVGNHGDTLGACDNDNQPPEAHAGDDQCLLFGDQAILDGSQSSDPDGDPITFAWTMSSNPDGSGSVLAGETTDSPTFTPDLLGEYAIELVVSDGELMDDDSVSVFVTMEPTLDADQYTVAVLESAEVTVTLHTTAPSDVTIDIDLDDTFATASLTEFGGAVENVVVSAGTDSATFWINGVAAGDTELTVTVGDENCSRSDTADVTVDPLELQSLANALDRDLDQLEDDLGELLEFASSVDPNFIDSELWQAIVSTFGDLEDEIQDALDSLFGSG